jgi:TFIIF-interacting CTD phosphatase-like protein
MCGSVVDSGEEAFGLNLDFLTQSSRDGSNGKLKYPGLRTKDLGVLEDEDNTKLERSGKLRLVLDLDETLIHCELLKKVVPAKKQCYVTYDFDSMEFESSYEPEKTVSYSKLKGNHGIIFNIKNSTYALYPRPNLEKFLKTCEKHYDIYLYTHGTKEYAKTVISLLGCWKYFSGIYGRDPRKSVKRKNLKNVLCSREKTVIIDDRVDVWIEDDKTNVCKCSKYVGSKEDNELFFIAKFLYLAKDNFKRNSGNDIRDVLNEFKKRAFQ